MTSVALIGFGEVGAILAEDLARRETTLSVWDTQFVNLTSKPSVAARSHDVRIGKNAADATEGADLVISAVTAAQTIQAARAAAPGMKSGALFLDLNSASPRAKIEAARCIEAAGGAYVEAAVMSPFPPKRSASPILLGGPHARGALDTLQARGFTGANVFSEEFGKASAAKLCRSVMVKGVEALLCESMLSARHYGVEDTVLASLSDLFPGIDWPKQARYMISRAIEHGARRGEEMREAAHTVRDAGLEPLLSDAIAERQDWAAQFPAALDERELGALLDSVRANVERAR